MNHLLFGLLVGPLTIYLLLNLTLTNFINTNIISLHESRMGKKLSKMSRMYNDIKKYSLIEINYDLKTIKKIVEQQKYIIHKKEALELVCLKGKLEILKYFVSLGANIHIENELLLRRAAETYGNEKVIKYLIDQGANLKHALLHAHLTSVFDELNKYSSKKYKRVGIETWSEPGKINWVLIEE